MRVTSIGAMAVVAITVVSAHSASQREVNLKQRLLDERRPAANGPDNEARRGVKKMWRKTFALALVASLLFGGVAQIAIGCAGFGENQALAQSGTCAPTYQLYRGSETKQETELQRALDEIYAAEDAITQAEDLIESLQCDIPNNTMVLLEQAKEHLVNAREAYDDENYGGAYGLANAAEMLAQNAIRNLDNICPYAEEEDNEIIDNEENETIDESADNEFTPVAPASGGTSSSSASSGSSTSSGLVMNETPNTTQAVTYAEVTCVETPSSPEPETPSVPPTSDAETSMLTIWYILVPNDRGPTCGDPWIHTYIVNTSGTTLYDVDFAQLIPSDLQLYNSYYYPQVWRYKEERIVGSASYTSSYSYTYPSTYTDVYSGYTYTQTTTVSGDTRTVSDTYTYTDGRVYTYSYSYPNPYAYSGSYTYVWSENKETITYPGGYSYTNVNTTGREGTSEVTYTYTYTYAQSGSNIAVTYYYEYSYNNNYIQRFYTSGGYSSSKTSMSITQLGPMDAIYSLIRVAPVGGIDSNKDYYVTTQASFRSENGETYAVVDAATWREPYSTFTAIGAPYIGTTTFERYQLWSYTSMFSYPVAGGYSTANEIVEPMDSSPPAEFDLSAPADNAVTSDNTPELSWNPSSDAGSGIDNYKLYVDNLLDKIITDNTKNSEDASELTPGAHTWYVVAVDHAGNERRSTSTWTINIENSVTVSDNNLMDNYVIDNTLENALVPDNTAMDNLTTENSVVDNIAPSDNSTSDNTLVQETADNLTATSDNSTTTDDVTTTQDNASDNSTTSDNVVDNTADTSPTLTDSAIQDSSTTNSPSTADGTTTQDNTTTSDTTVSDSSTSNSTQTTTETSTTSDATTTQETTTQSSTTTDTTATTDTTSTSSTSEPATTSTTSSTDGTTSSATDTSATSDTTTNTSTNTSTDTSTTDTSATQETTSATSPGNSVWGHSQGKDGVI